MYQLPLQIVIYTVWLYWLSVVVMIARSRIRLGAEAGAVPRSTRERWMWLLWVPTVIAWLVLPDLAYNASSPVLRAAPWAIAHSNGAIYWLATVAAIVAYVLTVPCWLTLGSNWSLAIVPGKRTSLVTRGFYSKVRHPIYALGLLLMAATLVVAPSPAMALAATAHTALVILKASNEERFLRQEHGQCYVDYCHRTSRFIPRLAWSI
jgi:protein-S-isoprenylcysteine O-methyltransferase Ste14